MAGGYTAKRSIFALTFPDPERAGLLIKVRSLRVGEILEMSSEIGDFRLNGTMSDDMRMRIDYLIEEFSKRLVEWNMQEDDEAGTPIPATLAGCHQLEVPEMVDILLTWLPASGGVSRDLGKGSKSGEPSAEVSIPMETLSDHQAS